MKRVAFIYDDVFLLHTTPSGHPESKERLIAIREALKTSGHWPSLIHLKPMKAAKQDVLRVHTEHYYSRVTQLRGYYDADTFISEGSIESAHYAVGAVLEAIERCRSKEIDSAFCAVRPPGHHAEAARAMGFCIFNNVAAGARYAQSVGYDRVFIIDFDVHHGNGTQHIFEEDDTVFYFSTHQYPHYPGTGHGTERGKGKGVGYTHNIPMHYGSGDKEYYDAYHEALPGLIRSFRPDIILVSAGYDLHAKDPLAGIKVTNEGVRSIVRAILCSSHNVPYLFCLEGGYNLASLGESVVITVEELLHAQ